MLTDQSTFLENRSDVLAPLVRHADFKLRRVEATEQQVEGTSREDE
jgi:hypothetical protein